MTHKTLLTCITVAFLLGMFAFLLGDPGNTKRESSGLVPAREEQATDRKGAEALSSILAQPLQRTELLPQTDRGQGGSLIEEVLEDETCFLRGRVLIADLPKPGVMVSLRMNTSMRVDLPPFEGLTSREVELAPRAPGQAHPALLRFEDEDGSKCSFKLESQMVWGRRPIVLRNQITGSAGEYSFGRLAPGFYSLVYTFPLPLLPGESPREPSKTWTRYAFIQGTQGAQMKDVMLADPQGTLSRLGTGQLPARLRVRSSREHLYARATSQETGDVTELGWTNQSGEVTFRWKDPSPIRITLENTYHQVVGSTSGFVRLSAGRETVVDIPITIGSLRVALPEGTVVGSKDLVAYAVTRQGPEASKPHRVELKGNSPPKNNSEQNSAPGWLEFKTLSPGSYTVIAELLSEQASPVLKNEPRSTRRSESFRSLATIATFHGEATVFADGHSRCDLR